MRCWTSRDLAALHIPPSWFALWRTEPAIWSVHRSDDRFVALLAQENSIPLLLPVEIGFDAGYRNSDFLGYPAIRQAFLMQRLDFGFLLLRHGRIPPGKNWCASTDSHKSRHRSTPILITLCDQTTEVWPWPPWCDLRSMVTFLGCDCDPRSHCINLRVSGQTIRPSIWVVLLFLI